MPTDESIKQAIASYGAYCAKHYAPNATSDADSVEEALRRVWATNLTYPEFLQEVLEQLEEGLGEKFDALNKRLDLDGHFSEAFREQIRSR